MPANNIKTPGDNLILLPKEVLSKIKTVSAEELKTLIYFFANPQCDTAEAAKETGLSVAQIEAACSFWRGAGIFEESEEPKKKVSPEGGIFRNYDSDVLSEAIRSNDDFSLLCNVAAQRLEKQLNKNDYSSLFYLYDFVRIPTPVICGIIEDCAKRGKKGLQYIVKCAIALYEDGIDTYERFEAYIARREAINSDIGKLRRLCGMGDRELTSKEKKLFDCWFGDWALPFDMVKLAYEKTVDATGKVSVQYMNGILNRWHESGFASVDDIEKGEASRNADQEHSFEVDEFIEAALKRGFNDRKDS